MTSAGGPIIAKRYRVEHALGRGGMGDVLAAKNLRTGRRVALKILRAELRERDAVKQRFDREAQAAGRISSDHVTQVLDVDDDPEHGIVIVFELLEGESLVERLKRTGPIPFEELHPLIAQAFRGLCDAHAAGVIHRDLKPSNVFLERRPDGVRVKLLDFGIAKVLSENTLTVTGGQLGTYSFMAPEQIRDPKNVDARADVYALTTTIYQSMTGQLPFLAPSFLEIAEAKLRQAPRSLGEALGRPVDPRLEAFVVRGLARDPAARFQSAAEAMAAWIALLAPTPRGVRGPAPRRVGGGTEPLPGAERPTEPGDLDPTRKIRRHQVPPRPAPEEPSPLSRTVAAAPAWEAPARAPAHLGATEVAETVKDNFAASRDRALAALRAPAAPRSAAPPPDHATPRAPPRRRSAVVFVAIALFVTVVGVSAAAALALGS